MAIDGRTVDPQHLTERDAVMPSDDPRAHPSLQFLDNGSLVYRGRVQAEIHPGQEVTVHGPKGSVWPPEPEPETRPARHLSVVRDEPGADPAPPQVDGEVDVVERQLSLVRDEPGADSTPPQIDDDLDIDF